MKHLMRIGGLTALGILLIALTSACFPPPTHHRPVVRPAPRPVVRVSTPAPAPVVRTQVVTAAPAAVGSVANGAISYPQQRIRYPLTITYPRAVNIYVQGHGLDPMVTLYDQFGNQLGRNDDGGQGYDSQLVRTLAPGNYIIEVHGFGSSTGAYTLTVN